MDKPKLTFPSGNLISHMLFTRGKQCVLKKPIRQHLKVEPGDYIIVRAIEPGVVIFEKLELDRIDIDQEKAIVRFAKIQSSRLKSSGPEGPGET